MGRLVRDGDRDRDASSHESIQTSTPQGKFSKYNGMKAEAKGMNRTDTAVLNHMGTVTVTAFLDNIGTVKVTAYLHHVHCVTQKQQYLF